MSFLNGIFNNLTASTLVLTNNQIKTSNGQLIQLPTNSGISNNMLATDGAGHLFWKNFWLPILGVAGATPLRIPGTLGNSGDVLVSDGLGNLAWSGILSTIQPPSNNVRVASGTAVTINYLDNIVICTSSQNTIATLPSAQNQKNTIIIIKDTQGGTLTVTPQSGQQIEGNNTIVLTFKNQKIKLVSDGVSKWYIL